MSGLAERLAERIRRHGPLPLEDFVEAALYDTDAGFYAAGGSAGRRGDFITSPEVGPLFGAVLARALDGWWASLGHPDPFVVVEAGAGPGTLARAVLAASPACAPALRYVLVEAGAGQRARHVHGLPLVPPAEAFSGVGDDDETGRPVSSGGGRGPLCVSLGELPAVRFTGVVVANELLDNLPFGLLVHDGGWREARVGLDGHGRFVELLVPPAAPLPRQVPPVAAHGARVPVQHRAAAWLDEARSLLVRGRVVVVDYTSTTAALAARPWRDWLRTYRGHERGAHYLSEPGSQDVTCEVALDQLGREPDAVRTQAQWLQLHGIDELVAEGRKVWAERAHLGDLEALRARSRVSEAEALLDPSGLGGFTVAEWAAG